jgi:hypothetical protein
MDTSPIIIYNTPDGKANVTLYARDGSVWMNQNQLAELFDTSKQNIGQHIANVLEEKELSADSVVKNFFTTATDGKQYEVIFYALEMILAIGFRVRSKRGTQFRIWANRHLKSYMVKGFVMDDERLKNPDGRPDYFDELLEHIRDIRASEKRFYQKIKDLFALSTDYDPTDKATQMFFAETQNKLLYAVTNRTAAELITDRADASLPNMGLTAWKGNTVRKQDIIVAKNYLTHDELDTLNRLVVIFLETAELRAKNQQTIAMAFWRDNVDLLAFQDKKILQNAGTVTHEAMEQKVVEIYAQYDQRRKTEAARIADTLDMEELNTLEEQIKNKKTK